MLPVLSETATEFDLGPLSWVQGEIDEALTRGNDALALFRGNPGDGASLKHARAHVHQAAGAIQMVGLDAVVAFTDEIERHLVRLEDLPADKVPGAVDLVVHAVSRLRVFLGDVANGAPPVPLTLFGEYEAMQKSRGVEISAPTDLFYPDLSVRAPRSAPTEIMPAARLASHLLKERRQYQRGLLEWLRGSEAGAASMREAIAAIEDVTTQPSLRAFWWTVAALLEALERRYEATLVAVFSTMEEIGGMGARTAAFAIEPDAAVVLEGTTCADMHGVPDHLKVTVIGNGPAITASRLPPIVKPSPETTVSSG
jgi:chemosensory pili system protein ChpA (sensor histidine kinase/response regulator)